MQEVAFECTIPVIGLGQGCGILSILFIKLKQSNFFIQLLAGLN
jgi:hypothetical protein